MAIRTARNTGRLVESLTGTRGKRTSTGKRTRGRRGSVAADLISEPPSPWFVVILSFGPSGFFSSTTALTGSGFNLDDDGQEEEEER